MRIKKGLMLKEKDKRRKRVLVVKGYDKDNKEYCLMENLKTNRITKIHKEQLTKRFEKN